MKVLDVNVVLACHRGDHPLHAVGRPWLDRLLSAGDEFSVIDGVAGAFVRLATNRRIFVVPTPVTEAFGYLAALRSQPGHVPLAPGGRHAALFEQLCIDGDATGDLVPDAQLAAVAVEYGGEVVSFDRDFARFSQVRWQQPRGGLL